MHIVSGVKDAVKCQGWRGKGQDKVHIGQKVHMGGDGLGLNNMNA